MTQDDTDATPVVTLPVGPSATDATPPPKKEYVEGQILSINYTPRGPVKVVWRGGKQTVQEPTATMEMEAIGTVSRKEMQAFSTLCVMYDSVCAQPERKVPLLLREASAILGKPILKNLARKGLIEIETLQMQNDKKEHFSHAFIWLTNEGLGIRNVLVEQAKLSAVTAEGSATTDLPSDNTAAPVSEDQPQAQANP